MNKTRVTLVVPNTRYREDYLWSVFPSRGLLSIAAVLRKAGFAVQVVDADIDNLSSNQVLDRIAQFESRAVGITMNTFQAWAAYNLARWVKTVRRDAVVFAGGPHPSVVPESVLQEPAVDAAVIGEGELSTVNLVEAIDSGTTFDDMTGIAYRDATGAVRRNRPRAPVPKLDDLPFPAYDLAGDLRRYPGTVPTLQPPAMHVMASRGCPYPCTFCSDAVFGKTVRYLTPRRVANEVELLHRDFGIREIFFQDDTLNLNRDWFTVVCDELIARGLNRKVTFKAQFRVNRKLLDETLLAKAKAAGCWAIFYGVESGSQAVLDIMKKGITVDEIRRAFALTRQAGIKTIASFMIGNVGDTTATVGETMRLCLDIEPDEFGFAVATPLPGTVFYRIAQEKGWIESYDWRDYSEFTPVSRNQALTRAEIKALRDRADQEVRFAFSKRRKERALSELRPPGGRPAGPPPPKPGATPPPIPAVVPAPAVQPAASPAPASRISSTSIPKASPPATSPPPAAEQPAAPSPRISSTAIPKVSLPAASPPPAAERPAAPSPAPPTAASQAAKPSVSAVPATIPAELLTASPTLSPRISSTTIPKVAPPATSTTSAAGRPAAPAPVPAPDLPTAAPAPAEPKADSAPARPHSAKAQAGPAEPPDPAASPASPPPAEHPSAPAPMKSPAAPPPQERSSAASKKGGFRALLWKLRHPFSRDFKRRIAYFPVLGPIVRYLYWCAMLPHRVNKIHDYIRDVLRILARHGRPGGAGGAAPGAPPPSAASAAWAAVNWANLPPDEVRKLMDQRFAAGEAYNRMYLWDELRNEELTDTFRNTFLRGRDPARMSILDIGCGLGGLAEQIRECREFVGIDVSEVAVHDAIRRYGSRPNYRFLRMDATKLEFPDGRFDAVAAREVLEHLPKPEQCLAEAFRVLKRGGVLILSSPNRDSLHLRVNRLLGNEDFKCSYDHIREFGYDEMRGMLDRAGFRIRHGAGVFLMPYWGIPGVDDPVRPFTDESPEMLDVLRQLGRRAGPEYAFIYVLEAEKPK